MEIKEGIIIVDKPEGLTSFQVVKKVKRVLSVRKAGHLGTLDPIAKGVLVICLGKATRFSAYIPDSPKEYEGIGILGIETDTMDITGKVIKEKKVPSSITKKDLLSNTKEFVGEIEQTPPIFSAIKISGVPLYKLARAGVAVSPKKRKVVVHRFEILDFSSPFFRFRVICERGTYVRSLVHDLGKSLGVGACLKSLNRTRSGPFTIDMAAKLEDLEISSTIPIISLEDVLLKVYPKLTVFKDRLFRNGGFLEIGGIPDGMYLVFSKEGEMLGLGKKEAGMLKPLRILNR